MLQHKLCVVLTCVACACTMIEAAVFYRSAAQVYRLPAAAAAEVAASPTATENIQTQQPPQQQQQQLQPPSIDSQHSGYAIVAPLTKLAHITYDSVPITHTPYEHVPLFQRISHVEAPLRRL